MDSVTCKSPGCAKDTSARGLCRGHYAQARSAVLAGKTSWEKLEAKGYAEKPAVPRAAQFSALWLQ